MSQTLTACDPPDSLGVIELVSETLDVLRLASESAFGRASHSGQSISEKELDRLSVGPLTGRVPELCPLAQLLFAWVVDRMQKGAIRSAIGTRVAIDGDWGQIRLLQALLEAEGVSEDDARQTTASLHGLNKLRVAAAHSLVADIRTAFELFGQTEVPSSTRAAWDICVDAVVASIKSISDILKEPDATPT
ncbi:MAG: hypothetical protein PVI86_15995 [Phycisphaerae bacterium]